jgi:putative Mg2+ transporter-C (MgtC) family protein
MTARSSMLTSACACALLALPLGWERERQSRSTDLRTYPLRSVCICGVLLLAQRRAGGPSEQADVFFGILDGIGFVSSGALQLDDHVVAHTFSSRGSYDAVN